MDGLFISHSLGFFNQAACGGARAHRVCQDEITHTVLGGPRVAAEWQTRTPPQWFFHLAGDAFDFLTGVFEPTLCLGLLHGIRGDEQDLYRTISKIGTQGNRVPRLTAVPAHGAGCAARG